MAIGAAVASTVIGAGTSLIGMNKANNAAKDATRAQVAAQQDALKLQQYMFDQSRSDQMPYLQTGTAALGQLAALYGVNPNTAQVRDVGQVKRGHPFAGMTLQERNALTPDDKNAIRQEHFARPKGNVFASGNANQTRENALSGFFASPGYQFRLKEGINALDKSAAARGNLLGGAQIKAVQAFGEGLASQEYQNYVGGLQSLAGVGQTSANNLNALGQNYANAGSQIHGNIGDARASGFANQSNIFNQGIGGISNNLQYGLGQLPWDKWFPPKSG